MRLLLIIAIIWAYFWAKRNGRLPKVLGAKPPHISARNTAIFGMVLTVVIYIVTLLRAQHNATAWEAVRALIPPAILFLAALGFIVWRLWREPDEKGLAMGIAFPIALVIALAMGVGDIYLNGSYEERSWLPLAWLFAFADPLWGLLLYVMLPTLLRLAYKSLRASLALPAGTRPNLAYVAGFALLGLVGYKSTWHQTQRFSENSTEPFRVDKTQESIDPLYQCLWNMGSDEAEGAAFPDTSMWKRIVDPADLGQKCGRATEYLSKRPYTVSYDRPQPHTFRLTVTERGWRSAPVHKLWVDQTGVLRESVSHDGRKDSLKVLNSFTLANLLYVQHQIDAYAARNPGHEYPRRLSEPRSSIEEPLPASALAVRGMKSCGYKQNNAIGSCLRDSNRRKLMYWAQLDPFGRVTSYVLLVPSSVFNNSNEPLDTWVGERFRSYRRDSNGVIHAYGGGRDAKDTDLPPQPDELARAQKTADEMLVRMTEDQRRDSLGRIAWDSVRKFRADSAKRDSISRGLKTAK